MSEGKSRIILTLTDNAKTALKVIAAQQGTTASAIVESWIAQHTEMDEKQPA